MIEEEIKEVKVKVGIKQQPPEIIYELLEDLAQERLNKAFDILFEETMRTA